MYVVIRSIVINSKDSKWRWKNKINCYKVSCLMVPTFMRILDNWYIKSECHSHCPTGNAVQFVIIISFRFLLSSFICFGPFPSSLNITQLPAVLTIPPPHATLKSSRASLQTMISCICRLFDAWSKSLIDYNSDWQERKLGNNCFTKAYSTIGQREQGGKIKKIKQWRKEDVMWNRKIRETRKVVIQMQSALYRTRRGTKRNKMRKNS
jgi:hypothetical protein